MERTELMQTLANLANHDFEWKAQRLQKFEEEFKKQRPKILDTVRRVIASGQLNTYTKNVPNTCREINTRMATLQSQIAAWSFRNFGGLDSNCSKLTNFPLGNLSSLMGMMEELGELAEAQLDNDLDAGIDAFADFMIFFCDFCNRSGISIIITEFEYEEILIEKCKQGALEESFLPPTFSTAKPIESMSTVLGKLVHVNLKAHQGIRGLNDPDMFAIANHSAAMHVFARLLQLTANQIIPQTEAVWEKVQQRDWNKNPTNAHTTCGETKTVVTHVPLEQAEPGNGEPVLVQDAMGIDDADNE